MTPAWTPIEGPLEAVLAREPRPLNALGRGRVPAVIARGAFPPEACAAVVRRLLESGAVEQRPGPAYDAVGASLVNRGADPDAFFAAARETHHRFARLFRDGVPDPIAWLYETLARLAPDQHVRVAREPDGRVYGPAIFRIYPAGKGHPPHFDSLRVRQGWTHYAAGRFPCQLSGVLCLQDSGAEDDGACRLYRRTWSPDLQPVLEAGAFHEYADTHGIERLSIRLRAGDFYLFHPAHIHEVPAIRGPRPRIVLAVFLGYAEDDPEVFVWA